MHCGGGGGADYGGNAGQRGPWGRCTGAAKLRRHRGEAATGT